MYVDGAFILEETGRKTSVLLFVDNRLAAIDGDDGYTGVKPQHRYVTCPQWHRHLDFFL